MCVCIYINMYHYFPKYGTIYGTTCFESQLTCWEQRPPRGSTLNSNVQDTVSALAKDLLELSLSLSLSPSDYNSIYLCLSPSFIIRLTSAFA